MTDILLRNLSVARKPRSMKYCAQCKEPCYPGLARYRVQPPEEDAFLHLGCATKWFTHLLREHRDQLKKEGVR